MKKLRCAIYTRKSSEEGLEQSFNSLDAQHSACEAYVASQKGEGWALVLARYDDGGFSGGSMERPGLQCLLADLGAGQIDIVVVYKVDRLTRSLADFARMVELFDKHAVSFVSVTQSFNTTSSMGRLTLNVLLSFAQFEREVTGERIRDKIAASKARGMWMGGFPPLGYDPHERTLKVNEGEAVTVRHIFKRYLELDSVHALSAELGREGVISKLWTTNSGVRRGGVAFTRGALFHLLRNRIYVGEIVHKKKCYVGQHQAIINREQFDAVQQKLNDKRVARRDKTYVRAPLTGRLFDAGGNRMSPSHTRNRHGRTYLYYVSAPLQSGGTVAEDTLGRLPAKALEDALLDRLRCWSGQANRNMTELCACVAKVTIARDHMIAELTPPTQEMWATNLSGPERVLVRTDERLVIHCPLNVCTRGGRTWLVEANGRRRSRPNNALICALRRAHSELQSRGVDLTDQRVRLAEPRGVDDPYLRKLTGLAFLAPDIQRLIFEGRQPVGTTVSQLLSQPVPLEWDKQRRMLGI